MQQLGNLLDGIALIIIEVDDSAVLRRQGLHGGKDGGGLRISPPGRTSAVSRGRFRRSAARAMSQARWSVVRISHAFSCSRSRKCGRVVSSFKKTSCTTSSASAGEDRRVMAIRSSMGLYAATVRRMDSSVPNEVRVLSSFHP